jgi:hypothetical protein
MMMASPPDFVLSDGSDDEELDVGTEAVIETQPVGDEDTENVNQDTNTNSDDCGAVEEVMENDEFYAGIAIPKNVTPVHEVEEFFSVHFDDNATKSRRQHGISALFDVVCGQACNTITKECAQDRLVAVYELAALEFTKAVETMPKKQYFLDNLFAFLPEKKFPDEFFTYVKGLQVCIPPATFWGKSFRAAATKTDDAKRMTFFGSKVWDSHLRAKRVVNNQCNPHWKAVNLEKSGSNDSAVYLAIRQDAWRRGLQPKASIAVENGLNYTKKKLKEGKVPRNPTQVTDDVSKEDLIALEVKKLEEKGFDESYFREWLCFILLGKPAGDRALQSYNSGCGDATKKRPFNLIDFKDERSSFKKQARRRGQELSATNTPISSNSSGEKTLVVELKPAQILLDDGNRIRFMRERIENLTNLINVGFNVEANKKKRIESYKQLEVLYERLLEPPVALAPQENEVLQFDTPL